MERWSAAPAGQVIAGWRQVSDTIGKRVRVELPDQVIEGIAEDIDPNGNLVVDGVRVSAGSVTVLGG